MGERDLELGPLPEVDEEPATGLRECDEMEIGEWTAAQQEVEDERLAKIRDTWQVEEE